MPDPLMYSCARCASVSELPGFCQECRDAISEPTQGVGPTVWDLMHDWEQKYTAWLRGDVEGSSESTKAQMLLYNKIAQLDAAVDHLELIVKTYKGVK